MKSEMKEMLKRALRTFVQAALGYLCANLAVSVSGVCSGNESLRSVLITLFTAAVACGLSAVMNIPKKAECDSACGDGTVGSVDDDVMAELSGGISEGGSESDTSESGTSKKTEKEDENDG